MRVPRCTAVFAAAVAFMVTVGASIGVSSGAVAAQERSAQRLQAGAFTLPRTSTQLIVGVAPDWNTSTVLLQRYERKRGGKWMLVGERFNGRLGANGLAWGRGLQPRTPVPDGVKDKREGDNRSPAGVFTLGQAFGFAPDVERHRDLRYVQVTPYDLFVQDPASPLYNAHVRLDHLPSTAWEKSQQMEQSHPAHALEVVINHNMLPKPVAGAGSAILFHIWRRDGASNTAGCTSMREEQLRQLVAWLDPGKAPVYVLLPQQLYDSLAKPWLLPASMKSATLPTNTVPTNTVPTNTVPTTTVKTNAVPTSAVPTTSTTTTVPITTVLGPVHVVARPVTKAVAPTSTKKRR